MEPPVLGMLQGPAASGLLLAGSNGPERRPARPDPRQPRWFEPLHVRDERWARERVAAQVAAGADVVVAPTWRTHRRALLPVGETRRARAWTADAVRVAREGVDIGLERRAAASMAEAEADAVDSARPLPQVAASLPSLDDEPEQESGRLLPRAAATERDIREQVGLIADTEPDLVLVEGQRSLPEVRLATSAVLESGMPAWLALSGLPGETDPEPVLAAIAESVAIAPSALGAVLLPGGWWSGAHVDPGDVLGHITTGVLAGPGLEVSRALERGASVVGILDGAAWDRLAPMRATLDERDRAALERAERARRRWSTVVARAAAMTEGGSAAWLAPEPAALAPGRLPPGFDWLVLAGEQARLLPDDRFRLVVDATGEPGVAARGGRSLVHGGLLVLAVEGPLPELPGCRILVIDDAEEPGMAILRRER